MTFFLDHDVPDEIAYPLQALGHETVRLRDVLPKTASDAEALAHAHASGWIMVSCNRDDFLSLAKSQLHCGIVILIRRRTRTSEKSAVVRLIDRAGESGLRNNITFA